MSKKEIPAKNYIILLFVMALTVALVLYLISWYNVTKEYNKNNSVMTEFLGEIKLEEIDSYLIDNPDIVIYIGSSRDADIKSFEKSLKKLIMAEEIEDNVIYLDTFDIIDTKDFEKFIDKYLSKKLKDKKIDIVTKANLIIIEDKEIIDVLYHGENPVMRVRDANNLFIKHGIIHYD
ncbi:MAG: hypothetical protein PHO63_00290 [Bacilli bacterium]|nr:hypothetical protein [Bacilli bacterium]MDD4808691.1 hypothetical protein [Bacilli bacterium]